MPTATANRPAPRLGLAASWVSSALPKVPRALGLHSAFREVLNFRAAGFDGLIALTSSSGEGLPGAIALGPVALGDWALDFLAWPGVDEARGTLSEKSLEIHTGALSVRVGLDKAKRDEPGDMPRIGPHDISSEAFDAAVAALAEAQARRGCELRIGALLRGDDGGGPSGAALAEAVLNLGEALGLELRGGAVGEPSRLEQATRGLVGLGPGLTPSGDDVLCGLLAAFGCAPVGAHGGLAAELGRIVLGLCSATNDISASYLRYAARGFFHLALRRLAAFIAARDPEGAAEAMLALCSLGHSSGADLACGFLFGLSTIAGPEMGLQDILSVR